MPEIDNSINTKNVQSIDSIYDRYVSVMYGVALKMVKNHASAEKILSLAFTHIKEEKLDFNSSQQNTCLQLINIVRTIVRDNADFSDNKNFVDQSSNNESSLEKNNQLKISNGAFVSIQQKQKAVLDDVFFGNASIGSAALKLGIDQSEVMKLLRETLNQIRTITEKGNDH